MSEFSIIDQITRKILDQVAPFAGITTFADDEYLQEAINSLEPVDKTPPNFAKGRAENVVHKTRKPKTKTSKRNPLGH